jgi:hypothetical protein
VPVLIIKEAGMKCLENSPLLFIQPLLGFIMSSLLSTGDDAEHNFMVPGGPR